MVRRPRRVADQQVIARRSRGVCELAHARRVRLAEDGQTSRIVVAVHEWREGFHAEGGEGGAGSSGLAVGVAAGTDEGVARVARESRAKTRLARRRTLRQL